MTSPENAIAAPARAATSKNNNDTFAEEHASTSYSSQSIFDSKASSNFEFSAPENKPPNAFRILPDKGAAKGIKTVKATLKKKCGCYWNRFYRAWSCPSEALSGVESLLAEKKINVNFKKFQDDYFNKSKNEKDADNEWVKIGILEGKYFDEQTALIVEEGVLEREIVTRERSESDSIVIQKRKEIEAKKLQLKELFAEIMESRNSAKLLEEYKESDVAHDEFLVEPGKTHLAAEKALTILSDHNCGVFQRMGRTVRVVKYLTRPKSKEGSVKRQNGALIIDEVDETYLIKVLSERQRWMKYDARSKSNVPIDFPDKAARIVLTEKGNGLPILTGFIGAPTLREDGSILESLGYDTESGLFLDPCGTLFPAVSHCPTRAEAEKALNLLKDLLKDFSFDGEVSRSVALAEIMTGVIRRSIEYAPAFGNNAPEAGSGKSLLADVAAIIATGNRCTCISPAKGEEENRKRIASALLSGDPVICIDNLSDPFESDSMCTILTSRCWQERLLGTNTSAQIPTNSLFIFTGNNLTFKGDMCSRIVVCRIDPQIELPGERVFDRDLKEYALQHRGRLVAAVLTVIKAYIVAGYPNQGLASFRQFSEWSKWIRSSLVWLGMRDPYESTRGIVDNDPIRHELGVLFSCCYRIALPSFSVKQLLEIANNTQRREEDESIRVLYDVLIDFASDGRGGISADKLGNKMRQSKGRTVGDYRLEEVGKDRRGAVVWRVVKI